MLSSNREKTYLAISGAKQFLADKDTEFGKLPLETQLDLAMKFYQCERGRLQKGKIFIDVIAHVIPLLISAVALIIAWHK